MQDVIFLAAALAFFALAAAYVRGLDRIVRSSADAEATHDAVQGSYETAS